MVLNLDWYTDLADVYRVEATQEGHLMRQERRKVLADIPCRVYMRVSGMSDVPIRMSRDAASAQETFRLACANGVPLREGDELHITRGGRLGYASETMRAFCGKPEQFYEPFGAVSPGLSHQEVTLLERERVE